MREDRTARRRDEILDAALDLFAEQGYHSTKISDIARKLNIGHGTCYLYYKSKLEIFSAVLDRIILGLTAVVLQEGPGDTDTLEEHRAQLQRIGDYIFAAFMEDERLAQIMFWAAPGVDQALDEKINRVAELMDQFTEQYLQNGVEKGFLRKDLDTEIHAKAINGLVLRGIRDLMAAEDPYADKERWIKVVAGLMLEGMT